ncbi:MAG: AAA family ATPase [Deltaproteobacteria bacterium]|nr:AAA family ATPase [Deltaproteobacteria bacterium]
MIIEKVIIKTFGGLSKREIDLKDGMNVVVGPNESGKSTIYNAIENTLFTPSKLTRTKFRKQMAHFIPVGGGDTIEVTIHFKRQGSNYTLRRRWGASVLSSLTLPDGSVLTDDDAIQNVVRECLQVPEGTCKTVMMTYQSGLAKTVDDVQESRETIESLGDFLRKTVMEMDGVSVDSFKAKIESSYSDFFGRWDIDANYPEGNRGIENPWARGAGSITHLFYEKERVKKALETATEYEEELDDLNKRISDHASEVNEAESYVKNNKALKEDAVKRKQIEAELKGFALEYEKLETINKDWPVTESKINDINKKIPELEEKEAKLNKEKEETETYQKGKELLDKYNRVKTKKQAVGEAQESLEKVMKVSDEDLKRIRAAFNMKSKLEVSLAAGKLSAKFTPKKDIELEVQKGLEDKFRTKTRAGETVEFQADGMLLLSHLEWNLEVTSGEVEYDQVLKEYEKVKWDIEEHLQRFNVKTLEEVEAINTTYKAECAKVESARSSLEEELGDITYNELKEKVKGLQVKEPDRDLGAILTELADAKAEIKGLKGELADLQEKHWRYAQEFGDQRKLLERLAEVTGLRKDNDKALSKLRPLPAQIENVDEFISEYEAMEAGLKELTKEYNDLIQERIRLEGKAPDRSVEEIERDLVEAEERFSAELRKGMAINRIRKTMEGLLEEMDSATYKRLEKDVSELLEKMTGGRYKVVEMEESVPSGFHRKDGVVMPYDILSTGTKDVLGIALRLAITKQFLRAKEGFVIMDDPLVDLDPDRQSKAADTISDFAETKQVILLTCHPTHAELLGGNRVELEI